jgi:hypothetical protein
MPPKTNKLARSRVKQELRTGAGRSAPLVDLVPRHRIDLSRWLPRRQRMPLARIGRRRQIWAVVSVGTHQLAHGVVGPKPTVSNSCTARMQCLACSFAEYISGYACAQCFQPVLHFLCCPTTALNKGLFYSGAVQTTGDYISSTIPLFRDYVLCSMSGRLCHHLLSWYFCAQCNCKLNVMFPQKRKNVNPGDAPITPSTIKGSTA